MKVLDVLTGGVVDGVGKIIDELHTSEDEKLQAKTKILGVQTKFLSGALKYEADIQAEAAKTVRAEAQGQSWIQRNWRPMIMLMFGYIIAHNYIVVPISHWFGATTPILELPPDLWSLLKIGIGGYTVGRTVEKVVPDVVASLKKKEDS